MVSYVSSSSPTDAAITKWHMIHTLSLTFKSLYLNMDMRMLVYYKVNSAQEASGIVFFWKYPPESPTWTIILTTELFNPAVQGNLLQYIM